MMGAIIYSTQRSADFSFMLGMIAMADHPEWGRSALQAWNEWMLSNGTKLNPIEKLSASAWHLVGHYPAPDFQAGPCVSGVCNE